MPAMFIGAAALSRNHCTLLVSARSAGNRRLKIAGGGIPCSTHASCRLIGAPDVDVARLELAIDVAPIDQAAASGDPSNLTPCDPIIRSAPRPTLGEM